MMENTVDTERGKIKYTKDGRKVIVLVGDYNYENSNMSIVKEIFISKEDGSEFPGGGEIIVLKKDLFDKPVKCSWKENHEKELEERYDRKVKYWEKMISDLEEEKSLAYSALGARVSWLKKIGKESNNEKFKNVIEGLLGFLSESEEERNKWVVVEIYPHVFVLEEYNDTGINRLDRLMSSADCSMTIRKRFKSLRLLSLYGNTNGDISYKINEYEDGSGYDNKNMFFFRDKKSAVDFIQKKLDEMPEYDFGIMSMRDKYLDYGIRFDSKKVEEYNNKSEETINRNIKHIEQKINEQKELLEKEKMKLSENWKFLEDLNANKIGQQ